MIKEKALQEKAKSYAAAVTEVMTVEGPRPLMWATAQRLIEAAFFNGFQSGVCWQKGPGKKSGLRGW